MYKKIILRSIFLGAFFLFGLHDASAHVSIATSPTTSCGSLDSTDFTTHTTDQIESRINLAASTTGISMYSNRDFDLASTTHPWTPNVDSWTKKGTSLDFTGVAGYNLYSSGTAIAPNRLGTLISPRHFLAANHYTPNVGEVLGFIDASGNRIERTVTGIQNITGTDIEIGVLDSDVPGSITYYPLIASTTLQSMAMQYVGQSLTVPMVFFDQEAKALIHSIYSLDSSITYSTYSTGEFAPYSENIISGDSGNPEFILIDNVPVLLSATYGGSGGSAPSAGSYINEINAAMTNLGGGYQVTEYNPTCFIEYPVDHRPVFTTSSLTNIITYEHIDSSSPIMTYVATDADLGQTITYALQSLTTATTTLNASDYFSLNPSTGVLTQIRDFSIDAVGSTLTLTVSAADSSTYPVEVTVTNSIALRSTPQSAPKVVIDPAFTLPTISGYLSSLFVDSSDRILIGGLFISANGVSQNDIARLSSTGILDSSFVTNIGSGVLNRSDANTNVSKIYNDSNGKIVFLTDDYMKVNGINGCNIGRLNTDGTLDTSFVCGDGGYGFTFNGDSGGTVYGAAEANGKTLVTGSFNDYNGTTVGGLALLNQDGSVDADFNSNFGVGLNNAGKVIAFDGDHNFYIAGLFSQYTDNSSHTTMVRRIAKFDINGTLDQTFVTNIGTAFGFFPLINDIKIRHDGKIVVVGNFTSFNGTPVKRVLLLNPNGTADADFAANSGTGFSSTAYTIYVQDDDKMIIGGAFGSYNGVATNGLVRLNKDGTLDTDFQNALGGGITGTVLQIRERSDGALVTLGGTDYNGTVLNNNIATLVTDTPYAPVFSANTTTRSNDVTLSGIGTSTAVVSIYDDTSLVATTTVDTSGTWQKIISLSSGVHGLTATQQLAVLNTVTSATSSAVSVSVNVSTHSSGGGGGGSGTKVTVVTIPSIMNINNTPLVPNVTPIIQNNISLKLSPLMNKTLSPINVQNIQTLLSKMSITVNPSKQIVINSVPLIQSRTIGGVGEDVRQIQKLLNSLGYTVSQSDAGSAGNETTTFGPKTRLAVANFQKANNIAPALGFFGPLTKAKIAALLGQ